MAPVVEILLQNKRYSFSVINLIFIFFINMHGRLRIIFFENELGFCTFFQCLKLYDLTLPLNASDQ